MLKLTALSCLVFISTLVAAQTGNISGKITDAKNEALNAATVTLTGYPDSSIRKNTMADAGGKFSFANLAFGKYKLSIWLMGFNKYITEPIILNAENATVNFSAIMLTASSTQLKSVEVTSKKAFVEQKIDRVVVNPDALIANAGTTAFEVLSQSPGVQIDQNGAISFKGKNGVQVFIDDKPTYLSGADLENYLRSLPSSSLEQIELMANPPAKYDAAGNAGVINIKLKKNKAIGFNGAVNFAATRGRYTRTNNSANFNYRHNKLNLFANLGYNYQNTFTDLDINRRYLNANGSSSGFFAQNSFIRRTGHGLSSKIGADYYASDNTTLGLVFTGTLRPGGNNVNNVSNLSNASGQLDSTIVALNKQDSKFKNGGVNANYRHKFGKTGRQITADVDYIAYKTDNDQIFDNYTYLPGRVLKSQDILTGALPAQIDIFSFKSDYSHPFKGGYNFDAGVKASYTKTDNIADYFLTANNITRPDYDKSNHFIYKENINAAYVNLNKEFKRISFQAGLRLENTISDGHQLGNIEKPDSSFKRRYTNLFPTLYVSYKVDTASNHQLGFNFGRRINRPFYQDLNPFISPLDKFTYYVGNPFLKPSFTNVLELSHTYKNKITTTLSYSKNRDQVNETIEIINGTYYSRPGNLGSITVKSISVNANLDIAKWLTFSGYTEVTNIHSVSDFYTGRLDTKGTFWFVQPTLQFKLDKTWTAELNGMYRTKITNAQFILRETGRINAGVQKKLSTASTIKLNVNDIFYANINRGIINNLASTEANWTNRTDSRFVTLSYSYRFGKAISNQRKHDANGAGDEQNRVKGS